MGVVAAPQQVLRSDDGAGAQRGVVVEDGEEDVFAEQLAGGAIGGPAGKVTEAPAVECGVGALEHGCGPARFVLGRDHPQSRKARERVAEDQAQQCPLHACWSFDQRIHRGFGDRTTAAGPADEGVEADRQAGVLCCFPDRIPFRCPEVGVVVAVERHE